VLHAFEKRTRKTPRSEIALAQRRLADLIRARAKKKPETS
jgi:phage-related protein